MSKLPFKSQPQPTTVLVGDEEIGILEFPKLYDLTPNERLFIKDALKDIPDTRFEAINLAKELAASTNQPVTVMFEALTSRDSKVLSDHLETMLKFSDQMEKSGEKRVTATVTAVIKYRKYPEWTIEDTDNPEQLPMKLKLQVYEFSQKEASAWSDVEPTELTEEDLGKSQMAPSIVSQTGENFIGDYESSAPTKKDSTKKTLVASPAG